MGVSENNGYLILGSFNKDPTIQGTIVGYPISETPICRSGIEWLGLRVM